MKSHVFVDNIKCSGCATTIINKVESIPTISEVIVDVASGKVSFNCDNDSCRMSVISSLKKWGYPLSGTGSKMDSAKSIVSCMIGRIDNLKD